MDTFLCNYRGRPSSEAWQSDNDMSLWTTNVVCSRIQQTNLPTVKVTNGLGGSEYLNSPSGPNATVIQTYTEATGQPEVDPDAPAETETAKTECFGCRLKRFLSDHGKWLLILALAVAAYLLRKK